jgi:hypothetical protein
MSPKCYLLFENFVSIILVGFKFQFQIVLKHVFKFSSKLFYKSMQYYNLKG